MDEILVFFAIQNHFVVRLLIFWEIFFIISINIWREWKSLCDSSMGRRENLSLNSAIISSNSYLWVQSKCTISKYSTSRFRKWIKMDSFCYQNQHEIPARNLPCIFIAYILVNFVHLFVHDPILVILFHTA